MTRIRPFAQVDVFGASPFSGNPVAVVLDATDLTDEAMQALARWTNLSETTFVLPPTTPDADYRVRILTPGGELPFAGHPTLGTAHAWLKSGGRPRDPGAIVQECAAGLVEVRREEGRLSFAAPPLLREGPVEEEDLAPVREALELAPEEVIGHQWVDNGPGWLVVEVASDERVRGLNPDLSLLPEAKLGVIGFHPQGSEVLYETRAFAPGAGVAEDPVTGSLNAGVAQWLVREGRVPGRWTVAQGGCIGRAGRLTIEADDGCTVWVGGTTRTLVRGSIEL
ncbi:MAG TPA: PhzF family phenazine biosynthesis protein [Candidatus Janibacter merdipullorum]|nr:PhzF family phenazine biosynthesis protein [Candidatus Janibacter merdipullorum]